MIKIDEEYVNSIVPNKSSIANAWSIIQNNRLLNPKISEDKLSIFSECLGSSSSSYFTFVDFFIPDMPVFQCSCPSRQHPCKHSISLLLAYAIGKNFKRSPLPDQIIKNRNKLKNILEKNNNTTVKLLNSPNKSILRKKIINQIEAMEVLKKIVGNIVNAGIFNMDDSTIQFLDEKAIELGNRQLYTLQKLLRQFVILYPHVKANNSDVYLESYLIESLNTIYLVCKKGIDYLKKRIDNPSIPIDTSTNIEEWLGHIWTINELKTAGLVQKNVSIMQLSFSSYYNEAGNEIVDIGIWINLKDGKIYESINFRPFKALKYLKETDSFNDILDIPEIYVYPGQINSRIRWENSATRKVEKIDLLEIKSKAITNLIDAIYYVNNILKIPLEARYPALLIKFSKIGLSAGKPVLEDIYGNRIAIKDIPYWHEINCTKNLLLLNQNYLKNNALLVRFHHDFNLRELFIMPLTLISDDKLIRLS